MSRKLFEAELGYSITDENSQSPLGQILSGTAAPGGDGGVQDDAPLSSLYLRSGTDEIYKKIGSANSTADWEEIGSANLDQLSWRNELVRAATVDSLSAGSVDPTGFSDNESGLDGNDFSVGDYLLADVDGTPALFEVTAVTSATDITIAAAGQAIADNDTFVVQKYLPDPGAGNEEQAIIHFPLASGAAVKISDVNWQVASYIDLDSGYSSQNGSISSSDSVNSAIEKLDGNQQDIQSASGLTQGDINYGSFTDNLLADNQTAKDLFQRIEVLLAQLKGVQVTGITTNTAVDAVPHASVKACKWLVEAFEEATPANRQAFEIFALTDGTDVDDTLYAKLKQGSNFDLDITVAINGANMELQAASGTAGVTVTARRIEVVNSEL